MALDALETLQGRGQKVGVITHVAAMIDRIAVQVRVEKRGAGRSEIRISDGWDRCGSPAEPAPCNDAITRVGRWKRRHRLSAAYGGRRQTASNARPIELILFRFHAGAVAFRRGAFRFEVEACDREKSLRLSRLRHAIASRRLVSIW